MPAQKGQLIKTSLLECAVETKDALAVTGIELPDGYIAGTASAPSVDTMGHKVLPGAFDEAIKKKGFWGPSGIRLLAHHRWADVVGNIRELKTVNEKLRISGQLNKTPEAMRLHEIIKDTGGMSFSVGFRLQEFKFAEENNEEILVIEKGDLMEVSIVTFPAHMDATMDFYKSDEEFVDAADTPSDFERALIANGWAFSRKEAHKLMQLCKNSAHLLTPSVLAKRENEDARPMLDAQFLKAASDQLARVKAVFGGAAR